MVTLNVLEHILNNLSFFTKIEWFHVNSKSICGLNISWIKYVLNTLLSLYHNLQNFTGALYIDCFIGMFLIVKGTKGDTFIRVPVSSGLEGFKHWII